MKRDLLMIGKLFALFATVLFLGACDPRSSKALPVQVEGEDAVPSRWPTLKEMIAITSPDYKSNSTKKSECLGRVVFEVAKEVEWPLFYNNNAYTPFNRTFSGGVGSRGDEMRFGSTLIAVIGTVGDVRAEDVLGETPAALERHLRGRIEETRAYIVRIKKEGKSKREIDKEVKEAEEWIKRREDTIKKDHEEFESFDPGLPNSEGYWTKNIEANNESEPYSVLRAYLTKGEHIYVFESSVIMNAPTDKEAHKRDFSSMLARFRTRAPNEIPTEPGVCVPFGFIPDDGKTVIEFKQSLRYPDAPGVLYTIETGNVHPRRLKATPLTALAHASINPPPDEERDEYSPVVTQRIGPRAVPMGGLSAMQGGTVLQARQADGEKYDIYNVFTGYSGWLGVEVLPYILIEMHTVNRAQAPEIKQNPPPFRSSMERLDLLLKSMRWRPTNPLMPQFQQK